MFRTIRGRLVNVMAFGPGDPVLIAHGGFTGNYELWLPPIDLLSRRWRCVTFDHRGAGENLEGPISRDELIADLFALMDDLGMERAVVAAESMGVGIVLAAALEKPERFRGLVLVDGSPAFTLGATK
jgi:pimeloyl-ACP methyl ester carboxylesterase